MSSLVPAGLTSSPGVFVWTRWSSSRWAASSSASGTTRRLLQFSTFGTTRSWSLWQSCTARC
eukprot:12931393-Prorocentrum_lima.AAC.1